MNVTPSLVKDAEIESIEEGQQGTFWRHQRRPTTSLIDSSTSFAAKHAQLHFPLTNSISRQVFVHRDVPLARSSKTSAGLTVKEVENPIEEKRPPRAVSRVVFPLPDGPSIARISPGVTFPLRPFNIVFSFLKEGWSWRQETGQSIASRDLSRIKPERIHEGEKDLSAVVFSSHRRHVFTTLFKANRVPASPNFKQDAGERDGLLRWKLADHG
ncbi:hypothetical protein AKJ16_DCAP02792 [Drosera capensis]